MGLYYRLNELSLGRFRMHLYSFSSLRSGPCCWFFRRSPSGPRSGHGGSCGYLESLRLTFIVHWLQSKYDMLLKHFNIFIDILHTNLYVRFYRAAGEIVAMGSQNGSVYLFRVSRDGFSYKKSNKIRGTQPLVQLDWSSDSRFLQTVTQDYDLVFCNFACFSNRITFILIINITRSK